MFIETITYGIFGKISGVGIPPIANDIDDMVIPQYAEDEKLYEVVKFGSHTFLPEILYLTSYAQENCNGRQG